MGIIDRIKNRLPVVGAGGGSPTQAGAPARPYSPSSFSDPEPEPESARGERPVQEFIDELVKTNKIVLFMKGSPAAPMCGFSANAASILTSYGKPLATFDILSDPEVRNGVKEYSSWPTLPQIYVNGEFLGGSDILREMHQNGELKSAIDEAFAGA